ncbi:BNR repeat-containing protein [Mucilaginibacter galii]|nr:BNR repeat-containing protein [Mucilaginibacter galii]
MTKHLLIVAICFLTINCRAQHMVNVGPGWAKNSVNANILRHSALASYQNVQYTAYYDNDQNLIVAKRMLNSSQWEVVVTPYKGNATDAHRTISIAVDGEGYLHVSWDHHGNKLRYCKNVKPGSLLLTAEIPMTGLQEQKVTYPEFYSLPNGNLLFVYRDGASGNGSMVLNCYNVKQKKWEQLQNGWINGEGQRSPYWQMVVDKKGTIHISWVWRESPDVASNHDMAYACSKDGGQTWEKSTGEKYSLPITQASAEYAARIPQKSELINTTAIAADDEGRPYTVTYWRAAGSEVPQYRLVYKKNGEWITQQITNRKTPFTLSGGGTKRIPISRPQLVIHSSKGIIKAAMIYRDIEQGDKVSIALCNNVQQGKWTTQNITTTSVGLWEPAYDTNLWSSKGVLQLFVQKVEQGDAETTKDVPAQMVSVLEWKPGWK